MSETRNLAIVRVIPDLLLKMLRFPTGTKSVRVFIEEDVHGQRLHFVLEHPDLPLTGEGSRMTFVNPVFDARGFVAWDADRMPGKVQPPRPWPAPTDGVKVQMIHEQTSRVLPGDSACEAKDREISPDVKGSRG